MRIHNLVQGLINTGNFIDSCFRWIYPARSIVAFIVNKHTNTHTHTHVFQVDFKRFNVGFFFCFPFFKSFIIIVLTFEIYMLPLALLVIFMKNYIIIKLKSVNSQNLAVDEEVVSNL